MTGIRDDDFSETHEWEIDKAGTHKQLRKQHDDVYGNMMEPIQNALDANDKGEPNTVEVRLGHSPSEPNVVVSDCGNFGITRDYDGDINRFTAALKATSEKIKRGLARKGIGMFQYTEIASKVIITSMDKEMIHRIPIYVTQAGTTAYGRIISKPNHLQKYKEEFEIDRPSTIVEFWNRDPELPKINANTLIDRAREKWSLRLYDNPKTALIIEDKQIQPTDEMIAHPPKHIQTMTGGHKIRGHLWYDPKGNGRIKIFQNGYLVESRQFEPRQVSGYIEVPNIIETTSGRTSFETNDKMWPELDGRIKEEMKKFPRISKEQVDEKSVAKIRDMVQNILDLKKSPLAYGGKQDLTKVLTTGDRRSDDTPGYRVSDKEPDPDREPEGREPHTRDNTHVTRVGIKGIDKVKRTSKEEKSKRKKYPELDVDEHAHWGEDRPLLILLENRDAPPPILLINNDNAEYPIYEQTKLYQPLLYNRKMTDWISELDAQRSGETNEEVRIIFSRRRVAAWKKQDIYPTVQATTTTGNGLFLKRGRK